MSRAKDPLIFPVIKPSGMSSFDVIRHFKRHLPRGFSKIGHFGTLDPFASGVLLIGLNQAMRLNQYIQELYPKTYVATGLLGVKTPCGDMTLPIEQEDQIRKDRQFLADKTLEELNLFFQERFVGTYWQVPPAYSATKHQGKNLYEWAREGVTIIKDPVERTLYSLNILKRQNDEITFEVCASTGTYIRTLFEDMAKELGTIGTLKTLHRQSVGPWSDERALQQKDWPNERNEAFLNKGLAPHQFLKLDELYLEGTAAQCYRNGVALKWSAELGELRKSSQGDIQKRPLWVFEAAQSRPLGLAEIDCAGQLKVLFNFPTA